MNEESSLKKRFFPILVILTALAAILNFYVYRTKGGKYSTFALNFFNDKEQRISGTFYLPPAPPGGWAKNSLPGILWVHYGLQNREALQPTAAYLSENGTVVLEVILKRKDDNGKARTFADYMLDVRAAADILKVQDGVDPARIYLSGHSIGANLTSLEGAARKDIAGVIAVGYPADFPADSSCSFLMLSGIFDELHQPSKIIKAFEKTLKNPNQGQVLKDCSLIRPASKKSRVCCFSYLSDHYLEPTDPHIARGILNFTKSPQTKASDSTGSFLLRIIARPILILSLFFLFVRILCAFVLSSNRGIFGKYSAKRAGITAFIIMMFFTGVAYRPSEDLFPVAVLSALFIASLAFSHFMEKTEKDGIPLSDTADGLFIMFLKMTGMAVAFIITAFISFYAGLFIHSGTYVFGDISRLLKAFAGGLYLMPGLSYVAFSRINGLFLKEDWMFNFFSPIVWIIVGAELIKPGIVPGIADSFISAVISNLRRLDFRIKIQGDRRGIALFTAVLVAAVISWRHILAEGYAVTAPELAGLLYLFFCLILVPAMVFTLIIRCGLFTGITKRLELSDKTSEG